MIQGLHIDITAAELGAHMNARAEHHRSKAAFYDGKTKELREGGLGETGHSRDPIRDIEGHAKEHASKAARFAFVAAHLVAGETYRLAEHDLDRWEFIEGGRSY